MAAQRVVHSQLLREQCIRTAAFAEELAGPPAHGAASVSGGILTVDVVGASSLPNPLNVEG